MFRRMGPRSLFLMLLGIAASTAVVSGSSTAGMGAGLRADDRHGPAGSRAETSDYTAEITAAGVYKAGSEGNVVVSVVAKGTYHINPQYPYKFKVIVPAADGLTYPKPTLQRSDGKFEETRGTFQLPFVAAKAGKTTIGGTLHLSVCSAANCVVDKVPLEVAVDIK
jgi:hypothetical protein